MLSMAPARTANTTATATKTTTTTIKTTITTNATTIKRELQISLLLCKNFCTFYTCDKESESGRHVEG